MEEREREKEREGGRDRERENEAERGRKKNVAHYVSGSLLPTGSHESICQIMQAELDRDGPSVPLTGKAVSDWQTHNVSQNSSDNKRTILHLQHIEHPTYRWWPFLGLL